MEDTNLIVNYDYLDPTKGDIEIVERKGIGHPDTLADGLAEAISNEYSKECLKQFGHVLHHNVDKLYIGAGMVERSFGKYQVIEPIKIVVNGRMSDEFAGKKIDIKKIQIETVKKYIKNVMPLLDVDKDIVVDANATQSCILKNWYKPKGVEDLPELSCLVANDTSVCISHYPLTTAEKLAYELERHFWTTEDGQISFTYNDIGQDIKVMVFRKGRDYDITMCIPLLSTFTKNHASYLERMLELEKQLLQLAREIVQDPTSDISLTINPPLSKPYILGLGSCAENGEEGLVGRGNSLNGVISIYRPHSMEAFPGKNPVYHTGRVLSYLTDGLARSISERTNSSCTVTSMTKNGWSLIPPYLLQVQLDKPIERNIIEQIVRDSFIDRDYLAEILETSLVLREGGTSWGLDSSVASAPAEQASTSTAT